MVLFTSILDGIVYGGHLRNTKFSEWHMMTSYIPSITCKELGSHSSRCIIGLVQENNSAPKTLKSTLNTPVSRTHEHSHPTVELVEG